MQEVEITFFQSCPRDWQLEPLDGSLCFLQYVTFVCVRDKRIAIVGKRVSLYCR